MFRPREISRSISAFPARTPTLPPATHTNSYALGSREILLVEPAPSGTDEQRKWLEWARGLQSSGRKLIALFATHHHGDHIGGLDVFARELNLPVWAHSITKELVGHEKVHRTLADGETITLDGPEPEHWEVLHTPGHAFGHLCLFNPQSEVVVVGDMVASVGTILIAPGDGDMREYLAQLERLESLQASVALPAHGDPIDDPSRLFRHYIVHRLMRESKVLAALLNHDKPVTAEIILPQAYDDTPVYLWPLALLSLRAHLDKLILEGRVQMQNEQFLALPAPN